MGIVRPLVVVSLLLAFNVLSTMMICHPGNHNNNLNSLHDLAPPTPKSVKNTSIAHQIVEKAFHESYAYLVETCGVLEDNTALRKCLNRLYDNRNGPWGNPSSSGVVQSATNTPTRTTTWPWWFQTLLRDAKTYGSGLFGPWHFLQFTDPLMQLCVYEKGATKMWRHLHCQVLEKTLQIKFDDPTHCYHQQGPLVVTDTHSNRTVQRSVFLRDPLERFLSAFLDKCTGSNRLLQNHCQPTVIFQSNQTDHIADFMQETKTLFEIFVDTLPLKWDLHFMPLSLHCGGLYQKIGDYDFVGMMDENFYQELGRFQVLYPSIAQEVDRVFAMKRHQGSINQGIERQASQHVRNFYTPNTIRRVLQYTSVDYMLLNLKIPQWAEDMLQRDDIALL